MSLPELAETQTPSFSSRLWKSVSSLSSIFSREEQVLESPKVTLLMQPTYLLTTLGSVVGGIEYVAEVVGDVCGVTRPRYELFIQDSLDYQAQVNELM